MDVFTIDIESWTASFRFPNLISGFQPTLEVPPPSTILGLLNAAAGDYIEHEKLKIGYCFRYAGRGVDLETIYQIGSNKAGKPSNNAKSNVIRREFLFEAQLRIYLTDEKLAKYFNEPAFAILLGRMNDLATVRRVGQTRLSKIENATKMFGQVIPFFKNRLPGQIQALPTYFTNTIPRKNLGTEAFSIIPHHAKPLVSQLTAFRDEDEASPFWGKEIFFHNLNFQ
ncbi:MAG: type I-B CRISPR-associated protein Cas5 [Lewinellaceae bacterium]|nr:type I-B CRISPR-associated protein Cas5 [Lewinellaceae bacterium]